MAHIQKIILLVLIVPLTLFPGGLILYVLLYEQPKFEMLMWIPIGMSILGVCSFIFHLKTLRFYKLSKKETNLPTVEPLLWILDMLFGIAYVMTSFYFMYLIYKIPSPNSIKILMVLVMPMILIGLWTVIEVVYLRKLVQIHKFSNRHSEIDNIKGERKE